MHFVGFALMQSCSKEPIKLCNKGSAVISAHENRIMWAWAQYGDHIQHLSNPQNLSFHRKNLPTMTKLFLHNSNDKTIQMMVGDHTYLDVTMFGHRSFDVVDNFGSASAVVVAVHIQHLLYLNMTGSTEIAVLHRLGFGIWKSTGGMSNS
jgi:hypothetical protein